MQERKFILYILSATVALLLFSALFFNREMVALVETNAWAAQNERLTGAVESFSAEMNGLNSWVDGLRHDWKSALGMVNE